MAVRTTNAKVLEIMEGCDMSTSIIDRLIIVASDIVDNVFESDTTASDTLLAELECWLTAHLIASTPTFRTPSQEKVGDAEATYTGKWGLNLQSTPYGQAVLTMDYTGKMAKLGMRTVRILAIKSFDDES